MKLLRYGEPGSERPGLLDVAGNIRDLLGRVSDIAGAVLYPGSLAELATLDPESLPIVTGNPRTGPCVAGTGKFICIGLNYSNHAAETGTVVPSEPIVFMKATSAIIGPNDAVLIPRGSQKTDWEVELGIVIGRASKYVSEAQALAHVAGYCMVHDVSERSFQTECHSQWTKGESCDTFGPIGPWLVTKGEVPDPQNLPLWLTVVGGDDAVRLIQDDGIWGSFPGVLSEPIHVAAAGGHHLDRHAAGRRHGHEASPLSQA